MHYGLVLPNGGECVNPRFLGELARLAEEAGWDGVFLEDHIVHHAAPGAPTYDPWISLAVMALHTERIRLGTTVTPLSRRRVWKVARETVTLDHLSNGRLILGVGLGDTVHDPAIGKVGEITAAKQRAEILNEALEVLSGLWTSRPFAYHGKHFHIDTVIFAPAPVQRPRIPIWVGGKWPLKGPIERATRWDGFVGHKVHGPGESWLLTPAEVRELKSFVESRRSAFPPFDIVMGGASRGDDWEQQREIVCHLAEAGATWWVEYVPPDEQEYMRRAVGQGPLRID